MKKAVRTVFVLTMVLTLALFAVSPLPSEARGGHGGHGGWWVPWAIIGGAAVVTHYYWAPYRSPYYEPRTVIIQEPPPVYIQPAPSVAPPVADRVFVYPRKGQSEELLAKDRYECHLWAVNQTGYDPTQPSGGWSEAQLLQKRSDYQRAQGACLDAREYTVK